MPAQHIKKLINNKFHRPSGVDSIISKKNLLHQYIFKKISSFMLNACLWKK